MLLSPLHPMEVDRNSTFSAHHLLASSVLHEMRNRSTGYGTQIPHHNSWNMWGTHREEMLLHGGLPHSGVCTHPQQTKPEGTLTFEESFLLLYLSDSQTFVGIMMSWGLLIWADSPHLTLRDSVWVGIGVAQDSASLTSIQSDPDLGEKPRVLG